MRGQHKKGCSIKGWRRRFKIWECLRSLHQIPARKSFRDPSFPEIPFKFLSDFARGYLDGDGSVSVHRGRYARISFYGSKSSLEGLRDAICANTAVVLCPALTRQRASGLFHVAWQRQEDVRKLAEWLYRDADLCLPRKRDKLVNPDGTWGREIIVPQGPRLQGSALGTAKLNEDKVREIRAKTAAGAATAQLCEEYGVSRSVIKNVKARRTWKHVTP